MNELNLQRQLLVLIASLMIQSEFGCPLRQKRKVEWERENLLSEGDGDFHLYNRIVSADGWRANPLGVDALRSLETFFRFRVPE